jgi:alpha-amylase
LENLLQYDWYLRKSLVDRFLEENASLEQLATRSEKELGDFVLEPYQAQVEQNPAGALVTLSRQGNAAGHPISITKKVRFTASSNQLAISYRLEKIPRQARLHFAIEFNFAGMSAGANDRYFYTREKPKAGQLQTHQNLTNADLIGLVDEWLGLDASIKLSRPAGIWAFPIQTVSQSEGGFELVHQSTAVMPHWILEPDDKGLWETEITLTCDTTRAERR